MKKNVIWWIGVNNQNLSEKDRISIAFNFSIEQVDNDK